VQVLATQVEDVRMKQLVRAALIVAGIASLSAARPHAAPNPWSVVVANGPFAGTYKANADDVMCFHYKTQKMLGASFKDFDAKGPRTLAQGGIKVDNPDAPGAKTGDLNVAFGSSNKLSVDYSVFNVPITVTAKGKGVDLSGAGKTKDGVQLRITASCAEVEQL
jgi:hypothetical protein